MKTDHTEDPRKRDRRAVKKLEKLFWRNRGKVMHLVPREDVSPELRPPLLPGRKSRRPRKNVWMP